MYEMSAYSVTNQLEYEGKKVAVITPDHLSLGKCVTCHNFVRKYASINDIEIRNMFRDGCQFKGFKKIRVESPEEEGFANMHFVLMISSDDVNKEVCVRRTNRLTLKIDSTESVREAITDSTSCVVIMADNGIDKSIELYHFNRNTMRKIFMTKDYGDELKFLLTSEILYIDRKSDFYFVNFSVEEPFQRKIEMTSTQEVLLCSSKLVVLHQTDSDGERETLICDTLQKDPIHKQLTPTDEVLKEFNESKLTILRVRDQYIWLVCGTTKVSLYITSLSLDDSLSLSASIQLNALFPGSTQFVFNTASYCASTNYVFLMYTRQEDGTSSSSILVLDLQSLNVTSILELQLTCNRKPHVVMIASKSGHKLFVQETFDNKVIFFQVFKLLPRDLKLQNITKQFIWEWMSDEALVDMRVPKHLRFELQDGF